MQRALPALLITVSLLSPLIGAVAAPMSETQKIEALIRHISEMKDVTFIRNGSSHTAVEAAEHLKRKWDGGKDRIKTARDFIEHAGSKSSISGKPYMIRFKDGTEKTCEAVLTEKLKALEAN